MKRPSLLQKLLFPFVAIALLLVSLELNLRLLGWGALFLQDLRNRNPGGDAIRILALGESTTGDLMSKKAGETWPRQLEHRLNQSGIRAVVYNLGRPGTRSSLILSRLPADLERYRPQIVISMMGINDSDMRIVPADPTWLDNLRLVKAFRWAMQLRYDHEQTKAPLRMNPGAFLGYKHKDVPQTIEKLRLSLTTDFRLQAAYELAYLLSTEHREDECLEIAQKVIRTGLVPCDHDRIFTSFSQCRSVMTGYDLLLPSSDAFFYAFSYCAEDSKKKEPWPEALRQLYGRNLNVEFVNGEVVTKKNYQALHRLLRSHRVTHIAMQYPTQNVEPLKQYFKSSPEEKEVDPDFREIIFVANINNFREALKTHPREEVFTDSFGGTFGHSTSLGNSLIAEAAFEAVKAVLKRP
ncbi:MAG TPA: GDSL-type esterase/lipase family protein [Bdellovibrionota bacterium]|jgi:lysophospholipase L1-like esterase